MKAGASIVTETLHSLLPRTLSGRLWLWGILLIVFPSFLILATFFLGQVQEERHQTMMHMEQELAMQQEIIQAWVARQSAQIRSMAQSYDVRTHDTAAMRENFLVFMKNQQLFTNIRYINRDGFVEFDPIYPSGMDVHDREYYKKAKLGLAEVSRLTMSRASGQPRIFFSSPVYNLAGEFDGLILGSVDMDRVSQVINQLPLHKMGRSYVVIDTENSRIKTEPPELLANELQSSYIMSADIHSMGMDNVSLGQNGVNTYMNDRGVKVIGAYRWLENLHWGLLYEIEEEQVLLPLVLDFLKMGLSLLAVLILALPLALLMVRSINQPIASLLHASEQLKGKNYDYRIPDNEISSFSLEFRQLCHVFNQAIAALQSNQEKLEAAIEERTNELRRQIDVREKAEAALRHHEQEITTLLENTPDIISRIDRNRRYVYVNPAIYFQSGIPHQQFIGKTSRELGISEGYCKYWEKQLSTIFDTGESKDLIYEFQTPQGQRTYHSRLVPEFGEDGLVRTVLRITRDITDRRQMEKEMARFDRLDLVGEMAASIGHEVRNPMTTVRGFLQMLGRKNKDGRQAEYFKLMISELDRANSIITEFLSLAKNKTVNLQQLNLDSVVKTLCPLIQADAMMNDKSVAVELESVPPILADEKEVRQLILNLARNGLEAMPCHSLLTLKTFVAKDEVVLAVQDEGTGIPAEVLDKMGTPFFTTKEQGTGLGLAVCYSIAKRHGATIEPETGPGGTTFYIRFPTYTTKNPSE